jgi:hypothetical protein
MGFQRQEQTAMKHTPGPWMVEGGGFVGGPVGYGRICQFWNKFEEDFRNADANARLIAAAPELLRVLKAALYQTGCDGDLCGYVWHEEAREIIAKAEGK